MSKETGGTAFPIPATDFNDLYLGMTLRDFFATKAMQGDWAAQNPEIGTFDNDISDDVLMNRSRVYYRIADAMIKARGE